MTSKSLSERANELRGQAVRTFEVRCVEETQRLAAELARVLKDAYPPGVLVGLSGDLGAGKTAFVQGFVSALDPTVRVTSPTFAITHRYPTSPPTVHMDLYRLGSLGDLEAVGYGEDYFGAAITLVEWVDRVPEAIPDDWLEIRLALLPSGEREIRFHAHGDRVEWLVAKLGFST